MLQSLYIQNVALIDQLEIVFSNGFHILTGETGAGKSIIIDAVNFVLGERANRDLIQSGAEKASVEAVFSIEALPDIIAQLHALGIPYEEGDAMIINRQLTVSGKNAIRINGTLVNLSALKSVTDQLVDVHGQHEHQSLLRQEAHIRFLDSYGGRMIAERKQTVSETYRSIKQLEKELLSGFVSEEDRARRIDILEYQINEIESAKLQENEDEELDAQLKILSNAQEIRAALELAHESLAGEEGALSLVGVARRAIDGIKELHADYEEAEKRIGDAYYALEDVAFTVRQYFDTVEFDGSLLASVESRIDYIQSLKRKYGGSIAEILKFLANAQEELEHLRQGEARRDALTAQLEGGRDVYQAQAQALSEARKRAAAQLEQELLRQLRDLGMENAQFQVSFSGLPSPSADGTDRVEFLLSTNKGEPVKPLQKVASGGELSRIMLAFKTIQFGNIPTIIFDEIDTGISGQIASAVGLKMLQIAKGHQVLCVTHLPQIAAMADVHYHVEKFEQNEHTYSTVAQLDGEERIRELAHIMGADEKDIQAYKHAEELLQRINEIRNN